MIRSSRFFCLSVNCALLFSFEKSEAHETWLAPSVFDAAPAQQITFDLTSGMSFPRLEHAIKRERIAEARVRLDASEHALATIDSAATSLQLKSSFASEGLAAAWVVLQPHPIAMSDEKVKEYFAEISAPAEVRDAWAKRKGHEPWKEIYTKCAKTFVAVGQAQSDESWRVPVKMPLELVPMQSPLEIGAEKSASFQLLENGKPLRELAVGLMREGSAERIFARTDADGRVTFTMPKAGRILLFAVHLRPAAKGWESNFTTLTLQAR